MQLLSTILCTLLFSSTVTLAAPTSNNELKGRSFEIPRIRRKNYTPNGPAALRKAYRKFSIPPPTYEGVDLFDLAPPSEDRAKKQASNTAGGAAEKGEVVVQSENNDEEFISLISVGGQDLHMDFDTGSSDLWVFNTGLSTAAQQGHTNFDPAKSQTFQVLQGATFEVSYGDGSFASGTVGTDTVNIGGATVQNQAVELATNVSNRFIADTSLDGLVGLAFSKLNTVQPKQQDTFFTNVAGQLEEPVMTASLKSGGAGAYEFGTIDTTKFTGQLTNVSVDSSNGFWQFDSASFAVGNGQVQQITQVPTAIMDTGTTLMLVSPEVAKAYYSQVEGAQESNQAGGFIFPCNETLPSLSIAVGDENLATVPPNVLNFSEAGTDATSGQTFCFGGVQSNQGSQFQIFGDVFIKSMFVVFDLRGPSLGLATPT